MEIKKYKKRKNIGLGILKYLFFFFLVGCFFVFLLFVYYTWDLPQPEKFTETPFIESTKIYDRTGEVVLYEIYGEEKREIVSFDKISENLKKAVLTAEDERFYQHHGVDFEAILRAILVDMRLQSKSQGGSTITQQLIRTVYLTGQKTVSRKIREAVLSIQLERKYSKDQILNWYLNAIPFGQNTYGAEAAARTYFNKSAEDLSLAQAAILTSLIPGPSYYSPYGPNKEILLQKKDALLQKMNRTGQITEEQLEVAKAEKIEFVKNKESIKAPDLVMYVKKYLENKYGEDYLKEKGLRVYTTLNWEMQQYAEKVVKEADAYNRAKGAHNAAVVVLDPKTGEILALMGSKDYFAEPYPETGSVLFDPKYDVATMGHRQPGSAFKPIAYAAALKKGYTPNTLLWDVKTEFNPSCDAGANGLIGADYGACYHPQNYDGTTRGRVTLRTALACSLNIPAVKTLYLAGIPETIQLAKDFGISTLINTDNYGLALVLGGGDVNLLELSSAYGVFATEGNYISPLSVLKITDTEGNIIEENISQPTKVLDTQIARQISSMLSDNSARAPVFGYNSLLNVPGYDVAAKTGTTSSLRDGWTMGYTPSVVVGVWTGNSDNSPTKDIGVGIAAPMWNKIIQKAISILPVQSFTPPEPINNRSPVLLGQLDPSDINTILYYVDRNNPLSSPPHNPAADPQYPLWQAGINNWLIKTGKYDLLPQEITENQNTPF